MFKSYLKTVLICLAFACTTASVAQTKVVVVPLIGDGSSHDHPETASVMLAGLAFRPDRNTVNYLINLDGELSLDSGTTNANFYANLTLPVGVTILRVATSYADADTNGASVGDVTVKLLSGAGNVSPSSAVELTSLQSTGFGDIVTSTQNASVVEFVNPVDIRRTYYVRAFLRTGTILKFVRVDYTTSAD